MFSRNLFLLLLLITAYSSSALALSALSNASAHTHINPLELKPASLDDAVKIASVCFLPDANCNSGANFTIGDDYSSDSATQCLNEGYTLQNCSSVQDIDGVCPYHPAYGMGCKCKADLVTCASNQNGVGASCDGKYASCTCKPEYQYNYSNCASPRSLSGSTCSGNYSGCTCPTGVSTGSFGCAEYYPSPCSGVCKVAKGDNCSDRTNASTPYGCMTYWSDCTSKCQEAYPDNCRNKTAVIASCPANATCTYFGDCAAKISGWVCNSGYSQSGNTCVKIDPCASITAITVPANATCNATAPSCPSKCTGWACNSGYEKSGSSCIKSIPCAGYTKGITCADRNYLQYYISNGADQMQCYLCSSGITEFQRTETCPTDSNYRKCSNIDCYRMQDFVGGMRDNMKKMVCIFYKQFSSYDESSLLSLCTGGFSGANFNRDDYAVYQKLLNDGAASSCGVSVPNDYKTCENAVRASRGYVPDCY